MRLKSLVLVKRFVNQGKKADTGHTELKQNDRLTALILRQLSNRAVKFARPVIVQKHLHFIFARNYQYIPQSHLIYKTMEQIFILLLKQLLWHKQENMDLKTK